MTKGDETLGPRERLTVSKEFARVYDEGRAFRTDRIVLSVLEKDGLARKAGFVAGKKVGNAVQRTRAKRLLRESYRRLKKNINPRGLNLVFIVRVPGRELTYEKVRNDMEKLLRDAGLVLDTPQSGK